MSQVAVVGLSHVVPPAYPELSHKRVLVTGATQGMGAAIVNGFAHQSCRLVLQIDHDTVVPDEADAHLSQLTTGLRMFQCTLNSDDAIERLSQAAMRAYGGLDVVINNVAMVPGDLAGATTPAEFDEIIAENLNTARIVTEMAAAQMAVQGGGLIINVAWIDASDSAEDFARYAIARVGLESLVQDAAWGWRESGVRVNAILPGTGCEPSEIAAAALYQASDRANWMSGQMVRLN